MGLFLIFSAKKSNNKKRII